LAVNGAVPGGLRRAGKSEKEKWNEQQHDGGGVMDRRGTDPGALLDAADASQENAVERVWIPPD
jgi:hypothetical protein